MPAWRFRGGITLIELLLVLVLLVIVGSLVIPAIQGSFSSVRLRRAGDLVLARWSEARAQAIEAGEIYQFQFTPNTGDFRIQTWTLPVEDASPRGRASTSAKRAEAATIATSTNAAAKDPTGTTGSRLQEPIVFHSGQLAVDDPLEGVRRVDSLESSADTLSTAILFFPDGTTSDASVVLANDREQYLRLTLRGLTGVARNSGVLGRSELERTTSAR